MERTFVMLKPSCVERRIMGEVIARFERKGFNIVSMKLIKMSRQQAEELYSAHRGKHFYDGLVAAVTGKPVLVLVLEGRGAVEVVRRMIGATDPIKAEPGTIRGDYGSDITDNIVHASDSKESYEREYRLFFSDQELVS
ncbi:MAG: nucleoside-diphosphate kinase [Aigarchaeota archaeon]|nr:nucleoside-diphosphate kinase [Aigarchaeota archaeon]MDW8092114.1 nucleoside-diphosphate kinase [Nitrososphaerota archaeon]